MILVVVPQELNLGPLAPHNVWELIMGAVLMVLLWVLFAKAISPKFEALYEERSSLIEGGILRAEQAQAEANEAKQTYLAELAKAREEAAKVREDAKNQGALILTQMRQQAQTEANKLLDQGREQLQTERQLAASELKREVGGLATTLAGRIVNESLTEDERARRTVDRFLAELESQPARSQDL